MSRELSAKDKAFIAEKDRMANVHRKEVAALCARNIELDRQNKELAAKVQEMKKIIAEYETHFSMSAEEFAAHCEREKKASDALRKLMSLGETY